MEYSDDLTAVEKKIVQRANLFKIPLTANFELTPLCNLKCNMCYIRMSSDELKRNGGILSIHDWLHMAEELKKLGTLFILLTGGEPLLFPHFEELYVSLRKMGFIITINTNATLITEEIAKMFSQLKPRRVNVTLYGFHEQTYADLCHNSTGFQHTLRGIKLLKKYGIDIKLNASVVKANHSDYNSLISFAREQNIPLEVNSYMFPCIRSVCNSSRSIINERLIPKEAARAEIEYLKYKKGVDYSIYRDEFKKWLQFGDSESLPLGLDCRAGKSSCWINWQGKMSPCVAMEEPYMPLKGHSIDEAWKYIVKYCENLEKFSECSGCKLRPLCNVCYAAACHEKRAFGNLGHLCEMAKWKKYYLLDNNIV